MDNPYEPPSSRVVDVGPARGAKPSAVYRACRLLWVSFAIDLIALVPAVSGSWIEVQMPLALSLAFIAGLMAANAALIVAVSRGHDWGRWLLAAFFALSWLLTLLDIPGFLEQGALGVGLDGVVIALEIYALALLFSAPGTAWFRTPE